MNYRVVNTCQPEVLCKIKIIQDMKILDGPNAPAPPQKMYEYFLI